MAVPATKLWVPTLTLEDGKLTLRCRYEDREAAKSVPGYTWNNREKCWQYPLRPEVVGKLAAAIPNLRVDKAVTIATAEIIEREAAVAQAKQAGWEKVKPVEPMPIRSKPFNHQVLGYNVGLQLPAAAILAEQGCGKSLIALAVAGRRFLRGEVKRLLIVAPSSVVPVWPREFEAHANFPFEVQALQGPVPKREEFLLNWQPDPERLQVAVTNYEASWRMIDALAAWNPDMIICDESQRIKTPSARQSKAMHQLGRLTKYRLILTGTPVTQGPLDFFSQYKFLDPSIFGNSYYAFRARYAIMGGYEKRQVVGYQNLPELIRKAHSIAFRVTKAEALDLPEQIDQLRYCELEPKAAKLYWQLAKQSIAELSEEKVITAANVLARLLRLSQVAGGFLGDGEGGVQQVSTAKLDLLDEVLGDLLDAGKKVVIFARFLPEIAAIRKKLDGKKAGYAWITGEVKQEQRGEEVRRFQEDPDCRVFLAQIQTAGLGITLHAADTAIFYSLDYSFANYDQARARIHRIGQRNACTYIHLVAQGTVDEKVLAALQAKKSVADEVVDNWQKYFRKEDNNGSQCRTA
jgi:SNF2 family DNA or RNA helicase